MQLTDLLEHTHQSGDVRAVEVKGIAIDSRKVKPGDLFIAIPGTQSDGLQYAQQAVEVGAVAVVHESGAECECAVPHIAVENVRCYAALSAAAFYSQQPQHCVAITGTNGKTSTAEFVRQLWMHCGHSAASIGTLGLKSNLVNTAIEYPSENTSPDPVLLHQTLQQLVQHEVQHCAIEASSHGLDQFRLEGVRWQSAAFTNLSRDHLDYHGSMEAYYAAKARLFRNLPIREGVVICADDAHGKMLLDECLKHNEWKVWGYGSSGEDLQLVDLKPTVEGMELTLRLLGEVHKMSVPVYGAFQALNIVCAIGLVLQSDVEMRQVVGALPLLHGVRGRLEKAGVTKNNAPVFVDYAHTPDALEQVLKALRPHTEGRLRVVFGCGGDRDKGKRPQMGEVAARLADSVIVTDDNPRSEDPNEIRKEILAACKGANEIGDRAEAIHKAVQQLQTGDVLVIAGKGHETTQQIGAQKIEFNDVAVAREALTHD